MKKNILKIIMIAGILITTIFVPTFFYAGYNSIMPKQVIEKKLSAYNLIHSVMKEFSQQEISQVVEKFIKVDTNKDGIEEIAVFYKTSFNMGMILLEWKDSKWNIKDQVIGCVNTLDYADFLDLDGDEQLELMIGGEDDKKEKKLTFYKLEDKKYKEFARLNYDKFSIGDLEQDGTLEVASLIRKNTEIPSVRLNVYSLSDYSYQLEYKTEFQYGEYPDAVTIGRLNESQQGIFVDMGVGAHSAVTEILTKENEEYKKLLTNKNENDFQESIKPYPLYSMDINNDGIIEVGMQTAPPQTDHLPMAGIPWINNWYQWDDENGLTSEPIMLEYSNYNEGYRFIIPEKWCGKFTIDEKSDEAYKVQSVHFLYLDANQEKAELLVLHHIPKEDWEQKEKEFLNNNLSYVLLGENDKNMLVAEIKENKDQLSENEIKEYEKMFLTKDSIILNFVGFGNNVMINKENIPPELTKDQAMIIEQHFFDKTLNLEKVGQSVEIKNFKTKEALIEDISEIAHESLVTEFVDEFYIEKDGKLFVISRGAPAKILPDSPYEFNQIDDFTYEIIQDEADMMRGNYRLRVEFKYIDNQWKINDRNTEFKNAKKDIDENKYSKELEVKK